MTHGLGYYYVNYFLIFFSVKKPLHQQLALGCILLSSVHSVHNHTHKIPCYSVMLMSVGLLGMVAAFTRKLCILPILVCIFLK